MPRSYRHIKEYEKEILERKNQGYTLREIGEKYGFTYEQVHNFISRHNINQRKRAAGIALKRKGRPPKDYIFSEQDKIAEGLFSIVRFYRTCALYGGAVFFWGILFFNGSIKYAKTLLGQKMMDFNG